MSELDPLIRSAWLRRHALVPADRAWLATMFSGHLSWIGSYDQALRIVRDEVASITECGGLDSAGPLLRQGALIAWLMGDGTTARAFVDRALEIACRTDDLDLEFKARRSELLVAYAQGILALDFFTADLLNGTKVCVLAVIEHGTRRIRVLGATEHPVQAWVVQQARNLLMDLEDVGTRVKVVLHGRDASLTAVFDEVTNIAWSRRFSVPTSTG